MQSKFPSFTSILAIVSAMDVVVVGHRRCVIHVPFSASSGGWSTSGGEVQYRTLRRALCSLSPLVVRCRDVGVAGLHCGLACRLLDFRGRGAVRTLRRALYSPSPLVKRCSDVGVAGCRVVSRIIDAPAFNTFCQLFWQRRKEMLQIITHNFLFQNVLYPIIRNACLE